MNNRLLSVLVLVVVIGGLFGVYYYFFVASTGNLSLIINGTGNTSITLTSEFGNSYARECERTCLFEKIPAVNYSISAKRSGYVPLEKTFELDWGNTKKMVIAMEKEIVLSEQKKKKEDTITMIKLQKSIRDILETNTGWVILGYQTNGLYYALPNDNNWDIFLKKEWEETKNILKIHNGVLTTESLNIYPGYIALKKWDNVSFYSLVNGEEIVFHFNGDIFGIKDTVNNDIKIITNEKWVFMYSVSEKTARENPLYDDIIQLSSGEIIALVKKTSTERQWLLSIDDTMNDYVFLIGQDTRERKILLKTPKNGKVLRYKNGEILFVSQEWEVFVVNNVK